MRNNVRIFSSSQERGDTVSEPGNNNDNLLDYLLYSLAGGVFAVLSFSFILWLNF